MSISSSLAAGVSGLNANAQRLASISDNISNSSTFGYKRTETDFNSMVIDTGTDTRFTAGGVRATTERRIDERGQVESSTNPTDIAINGRGFLPVSTRTAVDEGGTVPLQLMTTGSFRPDSEGILTNANGMVLMGWPADAKGSIPAYPRDSVDGLEAINVSRNQFIANPTTEMTMTVNLQAGDATASGPGTPQDLTLEYFGNLGQTESLTVTFEPTFPISGNENEWKMTITDSASGGAQIAGYTLSFNTDDTKGGTLASIVADAGSNPHDNATGTIELDVGGGMIAMDIGQIDSPSGITQLNSTFVPTNLAKNGSSVGNLLGVEITEGGMVQALYDSGLTRTIYQVPVIDVPNPNGLNANEGQTYSISRESGQFFLWDAGAGPVGETLGFSREASTTDVARELTDLIQTQRAYSSNAKIIQTVDEMLQETTNLKR